MVKEDVYLQKSVYKEFNQATGKNYKVTGDITLKIIGTGQPKTATLAENNEVITDVEFSVFWTDELVTACQNIDGMDYII